MRVEGGCCLGMLFSSAAGGAYWLSAIRCPSLEPSSSAGGGAHRPLGPLCPSSPSLPYPSLSTSLSFTLSFPSIGRGAHQPLTAPCPVGAGRGGRGVVGPDPPPSVVCAAGAENIFLAYILLCRKRGREILLPSAVHLAERLTVNQSVT